MIKFLKENINGGAIVVSLFLSVFILIVLSITNENSIVQFSPYFKWSLTFPLFFMAAYILITVEQVLDSYKALIHQKNQEIKHLKELLFEKENK